MYLARKASDDIFKFLGVTIIYFYLINNTVQLPFMLNHSATPAQLEFVWIDWKYEVVKIQTGWIGWKFNGGISKVLSDWLRNDKDWNLMNK